MRRHRAVLQTLRHMQPAEPVFVQNEGGIAGNGVESGLISGRAKIGRFLDRKIGLIAARPFALRLIPPNQLFALAPWLARRAGARSIIYDASVARPGEAPAV